MPPETATPARPRPHAAEGWRACGLEGPGGSAPARPDERVRPDGRVRAVAACVGGRSVVTHLECSGLSAARVTPWGLYLLAAGASPLEGDALELDLRLGPDARLAVRGVGALLARAPARGDGAPEGAASRSTTRAVLRERARLCLLPAPGIAAWGATHRCSTSVELEPGAELVWRDEVALGRHGEATPGTWWSRRQVRYGGRPLVASEVGLGPGAPLWQRRGVTAGARAFASILLVAPGLAGAAGRSAGAPGARGAALALAGPALELVALGDDLAGCRAVLEELVGGLAGELPSWMAAALAPD